MTRRLAIAVIGIVLAQVIAGALASPPLTAACRAPPLPPPSGRVVPVSTVGELQAAVASLTSDTTVLVRPGVYVLTSTLWVTGGIQNVAIRGSTDSCDDVVLVGRGMAGATLYNLTDAAVRSRDGASGTVAGNVTSAQPGWFVDAWGGDLHLTAAASAAIDRAQPHPDVTRDYGREARPAGSLPDVGADELPSAGPPAAPGNLQLR